MDLTFRPFAEIPEVEKLGDELSMNLSPGDRLASVGAGLVLGIAALGRERAVKWPLMISDGALLWRGLSGNCPLLRRLEIDRRHARSGVPGNRGQKIEEEISVQCPAEILFDFWKDLEQLPRVMRHVKSVKATGGKRSHWVVAGPIGIGMEWDAEIISEQKGRSIAWRSLPGAAVRRLLKNLVLGELT